MSSGHADPAPPVTGGAAPPRGSLGNSPKPAGASAPGGFASPDGAVRALSGASVAGASSAAFAGVASPNPVRPGGSAAAGDDAALATLHRHILEHAAATVGDSATAAAALALLSGPVEDARETLLAPETGVTDATLGRLCLGLVKSLGHRTKRGDDALHWLQDIALERPKALDACPSGRGALVAALAKRQDADDADAGTTARVVKATLLALR